MIIEKREVVETKEVYVARDGKVFNTERECLRYEEKLNKEELRSNIEIYEIKGLYDVIPLSGGELSEFSTYRWYRMPDKETLDSVVKECAYTSIEKDVTFPVVVCVEYMDGRFIEVYSYNHIRKCCDTFWKNVNKAIGEVSECGSTE